MQNKRYDNRGKRNPNRNGATHPKDPNYVRPKKALGQHFLTDMGVARSIAEAMSSGGRVLEVGCGTGVLTQFLLQRTDIETWGAEVDGESVDYLLPGIHPSPHLRRLSQSSSRRDVPRRTKGYRQLPLQYFFANILQGARLQGFDSRGRRYGTEGGGVENCLARRQP